LGKLPDFLENEFKRNSRYKGLKFPDIPHPETLEARYAAVMNEEEIELMQLMLEMDPYKRITARQAMEHVYFTKERAKDPYYKK
jgi:serine/threonine protein kinase